MECRLVDESGHVRRHCGFVEVLRGGGGGILLVRGGVGGGCSSDLPRLVVSRTRCIDFFDRVPMMGLDLKWGSSVVRDCAHRDEDEWMWSQRMTWWWKWWRSLPWYYRGVTLL